MIKNSIIRIALAAFLIVISSIPASAQSSEQLKNAASQAVVLSDSLRKAVSEMRPFTKQLVQIKILKEIAPLETSLVIETSTASEKAMLKQAAALELLAIKLRQISLTK